MAKLEAAKPKPLEFMMAELHHLSDEVDSLATAIAKGGAEEASAREELGQLAPDLLL